jgi:hypothetical protein
VAEHFQVQTPHFHPDTGKVLVTAGLETLGKSSSCSKLPKKHQIYHTFHMHRRKGPENSSNF